MQIHLCLYFYRRKSWFAPIYSSGSNLMNVWESTLCLCLRWNNMYETAMAMLPIGCSTNEPIQIQNVLCTLLWFARNKWVGILGARSCFSKFSFLFHLKNRHSEDVNFKIRLKRSIHLDIWSNFVYCSCLYLKLCKFNYRYYNQAHFH